MEKRNSTLLLPSNRQCTSACSTPVVVTRYWQFERLFGGDDSGWDEERPSYMS